MITYLNEILQAGLFGMQAVPELQFSHENVAIYLKLLLFKSWDHKVFIFYWTSLSFDLQLRKA